MNDCLADVKTSMILQQLLLMMRVDSIHRGRLLSYILVGLGLVEQISFTSDHHYLLRTRVTHHITLARHIVV